METSMFEIQKLMANLWDQFDEQHKIYETKGTKKAAAKARLLSMELKKMISVYRKASIAHTKGIK